jgi:hypothetical protein
MPRAVKKESALVRAEKLINGDRQADYGHPYDDFSRVTGAAKALGVDPVNKGPLHHALYMVLLKISRLVETWDHDDSIVDGPGYFGTYEKVVERIKELEKLLEGPTR